MPSQAFAVALDIFVWALVVLVQDIFAVDLVVCLKGQEISEMDTVKGAYFGNSVEISVVVQLMAS